jgi:hypothetical protein
LHVEKADADTLHQVYTALLDRLTLINSHRENLRSRGLTDEAIDRNRYRSLRVRGRSAIGQRLREVFGESLLRVPGFILKDDGYGPCITIRGPAGLLVPCRDASGRIVALKVRRDGTGRGSRYVYLSSTGQGGAGPGSPAHVPLAIQKPAATVRVTEGELKSDVAFALTGLPTISIAGAGNWPPALEVLKELGAQTVRLAYDADACTNPNVARFLDACSQAVVAKGFALEFEQWSLEQGKGIDDLLAAGNTPEVSCGERAVQAIQEVIFAACWDLWPAAQAGDLKQAKVVLVTVGKSAAHVAAKVQAVGLPAEWVGLTAKGFPGVSDVSFGAGKLILLLRENDGDLEFSRKYAQVFAEAKAGEVRELCVGGRFADQEHSPEEIAGMPDRAEPFTPEAEEGVSENNALSEQEQAAIARIQDVLADGGAAGLFQDKELLGALAGLKLDHPAEFAAVRASLKGVVVLRDLDAALKPLLRQRVQQKPPSYAAVGIYHVSGDGCICRERETENGPVMQPLCNFQASIVEVVTRDDGAEQTTVFGIEGVLMGGRKLARGHVPAESYGAMDWVTRMWHGEAVIYAGVGTRDHLRAAIELLSPEREKRTEYLHTGWRKVGDAWAYLHSGGAIGPHGPVAGIAVSLPEPLAGYQFPDPPNGKELTEAVRASLGFLRLGPDRLTFPLLAAVYRAVLGDSDFSLCLAGPTGCFKSEAAALCQQHFGATMDSRHFPANWSSTANALELLAFTAKDAVLGVDDFCPAGSTSDMQRQHREADRLLRGQGNRSGRQRLRADASLRPAKPPRGLTLSTGEETPRGQSLRARILVLEVSPGDFGPGPPEPNPTLTACQKDAADGKYASATSGFIRWLAPKYEVIRGRLRTEVAELREVVRKEGQHSRTPGIVADLLIGLRYFLDFAQETEAVTAEQRAELWDRGQKGLAQAAAEQAAHLAAAEATGLFIRLLAGAVASGRAHVASIKGTEPDEKPEAWGWRSISLGAGQYARDEWQPQGRRIGWVQDHDLYLEPEAAFAEAQELATKQGESLPVSARTLSKRLKEKGHLASWDENRERLTVRRSLERSNRAVLHVRASLLSPQTTVQTVQNIGQAEKPPENLDGSIGRSDGRLEGREGKPSNGTVQNQGQKAAFGQFGRSTTGAEGPAGADLTSATDSDWDEA